MFNNHHFSIKNTFFVLMNFSGIKKCSKINFKYMYKNI